jgi:methionyl-tRNA formyltransferase
MGTPQFALPSLISLKKTFKNVFLYTQPPKPSGRGQKTHLSVTHQWAQDHGIEVLTPSTLKSSHAQKEFKSLNIDIAVVAAYGLILPQEILDMPSFGCINIHGSLLPRWRGAAPIHRALLAGDEKTGITFMRMDAGLDTGDMISSLETPIDHKDTFLTLHDRLSMMGASHIVSCVESWVSGGSKAIPQSDEGVTYAHKLTREESIIPWSREASYVHRHIRTMYPWPGSITWWGDVPLKIIEASVIEGQGYPGTCLNDHLSIACGVGAIQIEKLQKPGSKPVSVKDFLNGHPVPKGTILREHAPL